MFRKKMQSLSIAYRPRGGSNSQVKKPVLSNYKFKYTAASGKSQNEIKQEIQARKKMRSQQKLKVYPNGGKKQGRQNIKREHELRNQNRDNLKSTPAVRGNLGPPKPPARRTTNTANNIPTPIPHMKRSDADQITGYSNIYKIKKMRDNGNKDSRLKLNAIVEDAKRIILDNERRGYHHDALIDSKLRGQSRDTPISDFQIRDASSRGPSYSDYSQDSRQYSQKQLVYSSNLGNLGNNPPHRYEPYGHSQLQKRQLLRPPSNVDLDGLLDQDSDEDEYLQEHLNRQIKNDRFTKRIQAKIRNLDQH